MHNNKLKIALVVAAAENNVIGKNNELLWKLPNDMKFFKNVTWAMPIVMGRKTYESLGKALTGRTNIVITHKDDFKPQDVIVVKNVEDAFDAAADTDANEVFVIGGGEIYKQTLPLADIVYLTRVHTNIDGDTFFPELNKEEWQLFSELNFTADEKHAYDYSFQIWKKSQL